MSNDDNLAIECAVKYMNECLQNFKISNQNMDMNVNIRVIFMFAGEAIIEAKTLKKFQDDNKASGSICVIKEVWLIDRYNPDILKNINQMGISAVEVITLVQI
jgi:hypothetical protein